MMKSFGCMDKGEKQKPNWLDVQFIILITGRKKLLENGGEIHENLFMYSLEKYEEIKSCIP